jgi:hypothetical protein
MRERMRGLLRDIVITGLQAEKTGCTENFDTLMARFLQQATDFEKAHLWATLNEKGL